MFDALILSQTCSYSLRDGASFTEQAKGASFDLAGDDGGLAGRQRHGKQLTWDKKKKKFVKGGGEGADNVKLVKTESGARLPASFRSGRFDEWKAKNKATLPRVGEAESERASRGKQFGSGGRKFRYNTTQEAKPLDPQSLGYERKIRSLKKKAPDAADQTRNSRPAKGSGKAGKGSRFGGANVTKVNTELKSAEQIRKARALDARKKARNARPPKHKR